MLYKGNDFKNKALDGEPEVVKKAKKEAVIELKTFFDEETFIELDSLISKKESNGDYSNIGAGAISAYGKIGGRLVFVIRQLGGAGGAMSSAQVKKITKTVKNAVSAGAPLVIFFDSSGADLNEGCDLLLSYGELMKNNGLAKGIIPLISIIRGSCYGANAIIARNSDFVINIKNKTGLFLSGSSEINDKVSENYGNWEQISSFGTSDIICEDEKSVNDMIKEILDYLPNNRSERVCRSEFSEFIEEDEFFVDFSEKIKSGKPYDIKDLIHKISDNGKVLYLNGDYGKRCVTSFCRIGGISVGVISNSMLEDDSKPVLDKESLNKIRNFVKICDNFNIPILSLVDVTGFNSKNEKEAFELLSETTNLSIVLSSIDVPFVSLIIGRAFGSSYLSMGVKNHCANIVYAWENSKISPINPLTGALITGQDSIDGSKGDIVKQREKLIDEYLEHNCSAALAATSGIVDDIFNPSETRYRLIDVFDILQSKNSEKKLRKLGF